MSNNANTEQATPLRRFLRRKEAAAYIGAQEGTLANWTSRGRGPRVKRIGRMVVYDIADLDAFVEGRSGQPTANEAA